MAAGTAGARKTSRGAWLGLILSLLAGWAVVQHYLSPGSPGPVTSKPSLNLPDLARGACEQFLLDSLHDPGSAQLSARSGWWTEALPGDVYHTQPSGRAKNAFGGLIKGVWDCRVRRVSGGWELIDLRQIRP